MGHGEWDMGMGHGANAILAKSWPAQTQFYRPAMLFRPWLAAVAVSR